MMQMIFMFSLLNAVYAAQEKFNARPDQRQPNRNAVNRKYQFARQLNGRVENRCNHRAGISKPSRNDSAIGESLDLLEGLLSNSF
jgi:hypothetical protein